MDWNTTTNRWVAFGRKAGAQPLYSNDNGQTWTPGIYNDTGSSNFRAQCIVTNGTNQWMIGGYGDTGNLIGLITSSDGITWANLSTGLPDVTTSIFEIIWTGSLWVAAGFIYPPGAETYVMKNIITSPDGITWSYATSGVTIANGSLITSSGWNGSQLVITGFVFGQPALIITSTDGGINWSANNQQIPSTFTIAYSIAWTGSLWIAVGGSGVSGSYPIFTSTDGYQWTQNNGLSGIDVKQLRGIYSTNVWFNNPTTIQDAIYKIENALFKTNGYKLL
jgi:hypothetical protein